MIAAPESPLEAAATALSAELARWLDWRRGWPKPHVPVELLHAAQRLRTAADVFLAELRQAGGVL